MRKRSGVKNLTWLEKGEFSFSGKKPPERSGIWGRFEGCAVSIEFSRQGNDVFREKSGREYFIFSQ
jgi:hypothetical protein